MNPSPLNELSQPRVATPTAFPDSGEFAVTQLVTLLCSTPGATIHYTVDGSNPDLSSPVFDAYRLPVLEGINEGIRGVRSEYTLKAIGYKDGMEPSAVASFQYVINRRDLDAYVTQELAPGFWMIRDFDDTKMYVVAGRDRALFIDAGLGRGDVRSVVEGLTGNLPLEVVITHGHPDHIALMGQFQGRYNVYMHHADIPLVETFIEQMHYEIDPEQILDLREGKVFDLGDRQFEVYEVPGHSPGCIVLLDRANGLLIAGDAVGSNRPTIPDSLWMQFPGMAPIDTYLSTLQVFRAKVSGAVRVIYGGHNDLPFHGEDYLDSLERAAQTLVDQGTDALVPSLRPTDAWQVVVGDRLSDPNWAAINVRREACLTVPADRIATLSNLAVEGAALVPRFKPDHFEYAARVKAGTQTIEITATTTSTRYRALTLNDVPQTSGTGCVMKLDAGENVYVIRVTSPDGSATNDYTLMVMEEDPR